MANSWEERVADYEKECFGNPEPYGFAEWCIDSREFFGDVDKMAHSEFEAWFEECMGMYQSVLRQRKMRAERAASE